VDDRAVVEVLLEERGSHTALEESSALFNLLRQPFEEIVILDALDDLLFVVEGEVARDRSSEPAGSFFGFDQGHVELPLAAQYRSTIGRVSKPAAADGDISGD